MTTIGLNNIAKHPAPGDITALVVDDQSTMRRIIRQSLRKVGITDVHVAENGAAALEWLNFPNNPPPDVILCDLHMDKMDGLEFANMVRRGKTEADKATPILLLTGESDKMLLEVAAQVGVAQVLQKPFSPQELGVAIGQVLGYQIIGPA